MINKFVIAFSSKWFWPLLILLCVFIYFCNYIIVTYLNPLMVIKHEYIFWVPGYYRHFRNQGRVGLYFSICLLFLIPFFATLYYSNQKKGFINIKRRVIIFLILFTSFSYPAIDMTHGGFDFIRMIPYSPLNEYLENVKLDYNSKMIMTPFGNYKMHYSLIYGDGQIGSNDRLFMMENLCANKRAKEPGFKCEIYPFKKTE